MPGLFTQKFHAYIDYPVAISLIVLPFILGFQGAAFALSVLTGIAAFALTVVTNHETGLIKVLPYKLHLAVDGIVGVVFVLAPFVLGFSGLAMLYYIVLGATVIAVVGLHRSDTAAA